MTLFASDEMVKLFQSLKPSNFPPYNIVSEDNDVLIELALAGYRKEDVDVSVENNILVISSQGVDKEETRSYHNRGIAKRKFCAKFSLSRGSEVKDATMNDGLLSIRIGIPSKQNVLKIPVN